MKLEEAIKTGKRFRQRHGTHRFWLHCHRDDGEIRASTAPSAPPVAITKEGILADDWIVEDKELPLTASEVKEAMRRALRPYMHNSPLETVAEEVCKTLGLVSNA